MCSICDTLRANVLQPTKETTGDQEFQGNVLELLINMMQETSTQAEWFTNSGEPIKKYVN